MQAIPQTHLTLATLPAIGARWPDENAATGIYAGVSTAPDGAVFGLVLLDAKPSSKLNWTAAMAWAESVGASLPTRPEAALLFANCRPALQPGWHWTSEEDDASYAWFCNFGSGTQFSTHKSYEGGAVAVRRFKLSA